MFIGREAELAFLQNKYDEDRGQLIVLYGRRRVGKTETLREFCKDKQHIFYSCTQSTDKVQLAKFSKQMFKENIPAIQAIRPEASFLMWLDCQHTFCRAWFHASQCRLPSLHPPASHVPIAQCVSNLSEKVITRET